MRKIGNIKKRALSILIVISILISMMPMLISSAYAANAPSGYTTDNNEIMAYKLSSGYSKGFDFQGYHEGNWRQVTFANGGFTTVLEVNNKQSAVHATGSPYAVSGSGLTVDIDIIPMHEGKTLQVLYTVKNTTSSAITYSLASGGDIQIGRDDYATITPFAGGFKMNSKKSDDKNAQLNFWYGDDFSDITAVDTCWYGHYSSYRSNYFNDLSAKTTLSGKDSGCAWSWKNRVISARGSQTYSVLFGVGEQGSETLVQSSTSTIIYSTTLGTKPQPATVAENASVMLPALTANGYEFGGWYSDAALTTSVGDAGASYTPSESATFYAKWTPIQSQVKVTVTKDGENWSGQSIALYQKGFYKYALTESGTIYAANVINGSYDIYKDGVDTGEDVTVNTSATSGSGADVTVTLAYTTFTASTKLDGVASTTPGSVDFRKNGAVQITPSGSNGTYTAFVNSSNQNAYDVYVNAEDSNQNISVISNSVIADYFTAAVSVQLDGSAYAGRKVVLSRVNGNDTYYYTASYDSTSGKYKAVLPSGPSASAYTYAVSVDGRVLSDTISAEDKTAEAEYYTAHVDLKKDGSDWTGTGIGVVLQNGSTEHALSYTNSTDYQTVLFSDETVYNVLVAGSNSPQNTGITLDSSDAEKTIDYWSVSFYTTSATSAYASRIIQDEKKVDAPATPVVTAKSFAGWYADNDFETAFDFSGIIEEKTAVYAKLLDPDVVINGAVLGESSYTIPNVIITGFPSEGTPVKVAILSVDSGAIAVANGQGYTVANSGGKTVTVTFGNNGVSMETAQSVLRANVTVSPDKGVEQTLTVTVGGNTTEPTGQTSSVVVSPVTLNLGGGAVKSGNLSFYQEGQSVTLPTNVMKAGATFAGWKDSGGTVVSAIPASAKGAQTYTAQWIENTGSIDFGAPSKSGNSFSYPNLTLTAPGGVTSVKIAHIEVENGSVSLADKSNIIYSSDNSLILYFSGGKSIGEVQDILQGVTFATTNGVPEISITLDDNTTNLPTGNLVFSAGTGALSGHYYMFIRANEGSWVNAYNGAKSYSFMGKKGYLATVTSSAEESILDQMRSSRVTADKGAWVGGTRVETSTYDAESWSSGANTQILRWVCGPEAGTAFYNMTNKAPVNGAYVNWNEGEPSGETDKGTVELFLLVQATTAGTGYKANGTKWNDLSATSKSSGGYFVEFGGYTNDPGSPSASNTFSGTTTFALPTVSGNNIYANGFAIIVSGSDAYIDQNSNGVLEVSEASYAHITDVSGNTTIYAGNSAGTGPTSGQITIINSDAGVSVQGGNVSGPVCVNVSGNVAATIDLNSVTMVSVIGNLTCAAGDIELVLNSNACLAGRALAVDKTSSLVIEMSKFSLNNGDNAIVAVGKQLEISGYGVNAADSIEVEILAVPPTYYTATVNVSENGSAADVTSVVLKPESGNSIALNRSANGVYDFTGELAQTGYTLYIDGIAVGDAYAAFADDTTKNVSYYTAQVTCKVNGTATNAKTVVLKAEGKSDITLTQQINATTSALVTGVYEYRMLESDTEYAIWVDGVNSGETLQFAEDNYAKTISRYTTEVTLTLGGNAWSGQTVTLRDGDGAVVYTLSENGTTGVYSTLSQADKTSSYNVFVNGSDSGAYVTPSLTAKAATSAIAYITATITTKKDGTATKLGAVTVGGRPVEQGATGIYSTIVRASTHEVIVAGVDVGDISASSAALTANFYTLSYAANGGAGSLPLDENIYFSGETATVLSAGNLSKTGYMFAGWNDGTNTYQAGATFAVSSATTLTAVWGDTDDAEASWSIGEETYYGSLSEALAAAEVSDLPVYITVENDITISESATISPNVVLDVPEGITVAIADDVTLVNEGVISNNGIIEGAGELDNDGTVNNSAADETSGTINIVVDNAGGEITDGVMGEDSEITGGTVTGPIVNNGIIDEASVSGDVVNNEGATISDSTINGTVTNNEGASVSGTTVNGNFDNMGTAENMSVSGIAPAPGGSVSSAQELVDALGGIAHIDEETGAVVLNGNVELDSTITITGGDIIFDLNGHTITGPNGSNSESGNAGDGGAAIAITGGTVTIADNSADGGGGVYGGVGGSGATGSGNGGAGIEVSGNGNITVGDGVSVVGGTGGRGETGLNGNGGSGITVTDTAGVTLNGSVMGGDGGSGEAGGAGGAGIELDDNAVITVSGSITGGDGGDGYTAGSGGAGLDNESAMAPQIVGTVAGGAGGTDAEGKTADGGTAQEGMVAYLVLETGLSNMKINQNSPKAVQTRGGLLTEETEITIECTYSALYTMPESATVSIKSSGDSAPIALDTAYYEYDAVSGVLTIAGDTPLNGNIIITATAGRRDTTISITDADELAAALEDGFTAIAIEDDISISDTITIPNGTTVSIDDGKTLRVADGGEITNNGTIEGAGTLATAKDGTVTNSEDGLISTIKDIKNSGTITNDGTVKSTIENSGTVNQVEGAEELIVNGNSPNTVWKVSYDVASVGTAPSDTLNVSALPNPLPTPSGSRGYRFKGWFMDESCKEKAVAGTAITQNTVLYADWIRIDSSQVAQAENAPVFIDGIEHRIGTVEKTKDSTTVLVDQDALMELMKAADESVLIPIPSGTDKALALLTVKNIEQAEEMGLECIVSANDISYSIPAGAIDTAALSKAFPGVSVSDIAFSIEINATTQTVTDDVIKAVNASGSTLVVPCVDFIATASYKDVTVELKSYKKYTARIFEITEEQANKITTAVVYEPDGTLRHLPTEVFVQNGKWYARVNSLTNSTYALIYNEKTFADAEGKWYENSVNEMGSRKVINGVGDDNFEGERSITRAEFAAIVIRALGLPANGTTVFSDVPNDAWYAGAVTTAYEYGIVTGRTSELFDPMATITRQEAMAMVARAAEIAALEGKTAADLTAFADSGDVSDWAKAYVQFNVANGLVVGKNGLLEPQSDITRAETATVILRLLQNAKLVDMRNVK